MADIQDRRPGAGGGKGQIALFHDNGDGSYDLSLAAHMRGWNSTTSSWDRIPVDNTTGALRVDVTPSGSGYLPYFADALTTTQLVLNSAGKFGGCVLANTNSTMAWLQVFDAGSGTAIVLGSSLPSFVIGIPCNTTPANGVGIVVPFEIGISVTNGIKVAATTTPKGATTVSTGLSGLIYYA